MPTQNPPDFPTDEEAASIEPPQEQDDRPRKLLIGLLIFLAVLAIALIVLLIWILLPEDTPEALPELGECPYELVDVIYGFGGDAASQLKQPLAVTFDADGNLWVSDTGNARVLAFDQEAELIRIVGEGGEGNLISPYGLAFSEDGQRLFVSDWTRLGVLIYSQDGRFIDAYPSPDHDPAVFGDNSFTPYEVRPFGSGVVAASNNGLFFFNRQGEVARSWTGVLAGSDVLNFNFPDAFAIDEANGRFYIADTLNRRVVAVDQEGRVLWVSGSPDVAGETTGFWQLPRSATLGPDGNLYVVDTFRATQGCTGDGHIVVLSPDGELLSEFGAFGLDEGYFNFPEKMAFSPDGRFAIADRENNRIQIFRLTSPLPPPSTIEMEKYTNSFDRIDN